MLSSTLHEETAREWQREADMNGATELDREYEALEIGDIKVELSCTGSVAQRKIGGRTLL